MALIRVSAGTEALLGLRRIKVDALPTTAYVMVGSSCSQGCAFCPQSTPSSGARSHMLSRVVWKEYPPEQVVDAIRRMEGRLGRVCLQCLGSCEAVREAIALCKQINQSIISPTLPVSVSVSPALERMLDELMQAGVDRLGLPVDVVDPVRYEQIKGGSFQRAVDTVLRAAERWPGRITVHVIAGLGESEKQVLEFVQTMTDHGVTAGLFSFTPVPGTRLEGCSPPPLSSYRRLQLGRALIVSGAARVGDMVFDRDGRLVWPGPAGKSFEFLVRFAFESRAFMTSGCPDCNRPFYNERPGGPMYNYPWVPSLEQTVEAVRECQLLGDW